MDLKRKLERLSGVGPGGAMARSPARPGAPAPAPEAAAPAAPPPAPAALDASESERKAKIEEIRRRLGTLQAKHVKPPSAPVPAAPPSGGAAPVPAGGSTARGPTALPAEPRMTEHGLVHVAERLFPPHHRHGEVAVGTALEVDPSHVAALALDPTLAAVDLRRMLLVDTETTGLAGGAGTLPFLIGLGWFEGDSLRLHQLFLRRPGEEGPMLRLLAERLRGASCLVTYNGKTFDWPLLRTRFVLNRLPVPPPPPHLDLLHCARRVFKYREGGARLVHIEEQVVGHRRVGDVDGSLIPDLYFRYLRGGSGAALAPVLEHNAHDLVLLVALLSRLARGLKDDGAGLDPRDRLGLAEVAARAEQVERALALARSVAAEARGPLAAEALTLLAALLRRRGEDRAAAEALDRALAHADRRRAAAIHFSLAKLYEHSLRNLSRALHHARHTAPVEGAAEQLKRVARLERRLAARGGLLLEPE